MVINVKVVVLLFHGVVQHFAFLNSLQKLVSRCLFFRSDESNGMRKLYGGLNSKP